MTELQSPIPNAAEQTVHPLTLAVVRHKLLAVTEEVVETMSRTCFSPLLNQSRDFSAVILDADAQVLAQAERVPIHMGAMPFAVRAMHAAFADQLGDGDVLMANDPYYGGSHLPDVTLAMPVWDGDMRGDIMAQLAAVRVGAQRLHELLERYGREELARCAHGILDAGEAAMRQQLSRWTAGTYHGVSYLDSDGCGNLRVPISCTVRLEADRVRVDFSDCPDQVRSFMNSPIANTVACVNVAFMYLSENQQTQNQGSARAIEVITRKGSIVDAVMPAPVTGCTTLSGSVIIESVLRAMETAAPQQVMAGFARRFRFVIAGDRDRGGHSYIWHYFSNRGGAGANLEEDGWSNLGVIHNPGGSPSPSVERTEASSPLQVERYELRTDSGGPGKSRGGLGGTYALRYVGDGPAVLNAAGEGVLVAPYAILGGHEGATHDYCIHRDGQIIALATGDAGVEILPGDLIVCHSASGGGCGDPREREPALVRRDVEHGYVSLQAARDIYGLDE
jgi:N-methylhydantoinase B